MATETGIVAGLRLRPYAGESDVPHLVRLANAEAATDGLHHHTNVDEMTALVAHPLATRSSAAGKNQSHATARVDSRRCARS